MKSSLLPFWSWILCALWMSAIAQAATGTSPSTDEAAADDANSCACASSCTSQQECQEADCTCAQKEVLPTDPNPNPLTFDDHIESWTYQQPENK